MEVIKELMALGILVEPEAVELLISLDEDKLKTVVEKSKEERPLVLSNQIVEKFLKATKYKIIKTLDKRKSFSVQDIVDSMNKRYDFVQNILMRKVELSNIVSINKCTNGKLTVIGMVKNKEKSDNNVLLELEDKTGSVKAVVSSDIGKKIDQDDIIAVHGNYNNKLLFGEKVVYPDIPLRRVAYSTNATKVAFITNHDFTNKLDVSADYIFIGKCDNVEKVTVQYPTSKVFVIDDEKITNPSLIDIDGIIIMVLFDIDPLEAVKKRFVSIENSDFLIDTIPDIILTDKDINANYKGISIVGGKSIIELKTRNIVKI